MKAIRLYSYYFAQFLKGRLAYKADFFATMLAQVIATTGGLLFILFLMDGKTVTALHGWSREEVLFIYGYSMLPTALFNFLAPNLYQFGDRYVIQGEFDRVLLRPLGSLPQVLFESFSLEAVGTALVGVVLILYTASDLGLTFGVVDYVWLFVSSLAGGVILLSVFVLVASLQFHFEDRFGIGAPVFNMINFGRYPLPIFNEVIQFILRWVIPFGFVAFYPATHFFAREGFELYCYSTPLIAMITLGLALSAWQFGVSRYASTGN